MRQVQDTLVWLAMILVVAAVVYTMPRVARLVAEANRDRGNSKVTSVKVSESHYHRAFAHRHRHRDR